MSRIDEIRKKCEADPLETKEFETIEVLTDCAFLLAKIDRIEEGLRNSDHTSEDKCLSWYDGCNCAGAIFGANTHLMEQLREIRKLVWSSDLGTNTIVVKLMELLPRPQETEV